MRKSVIASALVFVLANLNAQDTLKNNLTQSTENKHLNELGLDMTPFTKFYLNFSGNSGNSYQPIYMLTYRRYFKKSNFRTAIGGDYLSSETPSPYYNDSLKTKYFNKQSSLAVRIGYEFFQDFSKHWQVYYGADLRATYFHQKNDAPNWNGGYANGIETTTKGLGLAPVLGLRFKINKRISLITESSFVVQYSTSTSYRYYKPATPAYPAKANDPKKTQKTFGTTFNYPISLVLTFNI